jgi:hypothetical protein
MMSRRSGSGIIGADSVDPLAFTAAGVAAL